MEIIYVSSLLSEAAFSDFYANLKEKPVQQGQKYTRLLIKGFVQNNVHVYALSSLPVSRRNSKKIFFKKREEYKKNIDYTYISLINLPFLRSAFRFVSIYNNLNRIYKKKNIDFIVVDSLNYSLSLAVAVFVKIKKVKLLTTITDIPYYLNRMKNGKSSVKKILLEKIYEYVLKSSYGHIILTEYMKEAIDDSYKKYFLIEGIADDEMKEIDKTCYYDLNNYICLYSGALDEIYGIKNLVDAFIILSENNRNIELHLYGDGDCKEYIESVASFCTLIKYFGVVENTEVVKKQIASSLLINPRPTNGEYTRYSFPSKIIEYMSSGTPVLTTKLPGIPQEYEDFLLLIIDESPIGISNAILNSINLGHEKLYQIGSESKAFVMEYKTPKKQVSAIVKEFL